MFLVIVYRLSLKVVQTYISRTFFPARVPPLIFIVELSIEVKISGWKKNLWREMFIFQQRRIKNKAFICCDNQNFLYLELSWKLRIKFLLKRFREKWKKKCCLFTAVKPWVNFFNVITSSFYFWRSQKSKKTLILWLFLHFWDLCA